VHTPPFFRRSRAWSADAATSPRPSPKTTAPGMTDAPRLEPQRPQRHSQPLSVSVTVESSARGIARQFRRLSAEINKVVVEELIGEAPPPPPPPHNKDATAAHSFAPQRSSPNHRPVPNKNRQGVRCADGFMEEEPKVTGRSAALLAGIVTVQMWPGRARPWCSARGDSVASQKACSDGLTHCCSGARGAFG
jgi:hypothetical protein